MMALDRKYEKTPLPVNINKLPAYLRPIKPIVDSRTLAGAEGKDHVAQEWNDYYAQFEREEI